MDFPVIFEHPLFQLPRLHIPINPIDNPDDLSGVGIVKYAQESLIIDIGEWWLEEHALVNGAVFGKIGDDIVDEGHLIYSEITHLNEIRESLLNVFVV